MTSMPVGAALIVGGLFLIFLAGVFGLVLGIVAILAGIAVLVQGFRQRPSRS